MPSLAERLKAARSGGMGEEATRTSVKASPATMAGWLRKYNKYDEEIKKNNGTAEQISDWRKERSGLAKQIKDAGGTLPKKGK